MESEYLSPEWATEWRVHCWMKYISDEIKQHWHSFSDDQKRMIYENADELAMKEDWD